MVIAIRVTKSHLADLISPSPAMYIAMAIPSLALKDLVKLPVGAEWKQLGLQLGVPLHRLWWIQAHAALSGECNLFVGCYP